MDLAHELVKIGQLRGGAGCVQPYVAAKASAVNRVKKGVVSKSWSQRVEGRPQEFKSSLTPQPATITSNFNLLQVINNNRLHTQKNQHLESQGERNKLVKTVRVVLVQDVASDPVVAPDDRKPLGSIVIQIQHYHLVYGDSSTALSVQKQQRTLVR